MNFSEKFCSNSPFTKKDGEYDLEIHRVASVPDKHATNITGTYDKAYDEYTNKHGYIDPDEFDKMQPILGGLKAQDSKQRGSTVRDHDDSLINMGSPVNQRGYAGGGDADAYYISMAPYIKQLQGQIAQGHNDYYDKKRGLYNYGKNKNEVSVFCKQFPDQCKK